MPSESIPFDRAVDYYDETRGFPPGVEQDVAALLADLAGVTLSARVLEIGVGTGRIALPVSRYAHAVFGLDLSRPMMDRLRSKRQDQPVYLTQGDATRLPFPARAFDAAMAVHVFHLIPDWQTVIGELGRVLKAEGRFVSAWGGMSFGGAWSDIRKQISELDLRVGLQNKDDFEDFMREAGWRKLEQVEATYPHSLTPRNIIRRITNRMHSWTWRASDDQIDKAARLLREALLEEYGDLDASFETAGTYGAAAYAPPQ